MKRLAWLLGLALLPLTTTGCGGVCATYCDYTLACFEEDTNCDFEDPDEINADCREECDKALGDLSDDEAEEFDLCVSCVADEIGAVDECNDGDYADAIGDCDDECEEDGVGEFFEEFDLDIDDDDVDC